jgi:pimeloyl-ACP methyl ester carboxylesterase
MGIATPPREELERRYAAHPASTFVELGGARVHVRDQGEGAPIVMLHGALTSLHDWEPWAEALADEHRVVTLDLPPFGLTGNGGWEQYDNERYLQLIDALLADRDIEQAVIVGNSLGGYFAALYAAERPERVAALVLISPAGYPQAVPWPLRVYTVPGIGALAERVTPRFMVRLGVYRSHHDTGAVGEAMVERYFRLATAPGNRAGMRELFTRVVAQSHEEPDWVPSIIAPTLLLWGTEDRLVPPELAKRWLEDLPRAELIRYPEVGHVAMLEIPEQSLGDVQRFLDALPTWNEP